MSKTRIGSTQKWSSKLESFSDCQTKLLSLFDEEDEDMPLSKCIAPKEEKEPSKEVTPEKKLSVFFHLSRKVSVLEEKLQDAQLLSERFPTVDYEDTFTGLFKRTQKLESVNKEIEQRLQYFSHDLPIIVTVKSGIDSKYLESIKKVENCISFFQSNEIHRKAQYLQKFQFSRSKAYGNVRDFVIDEMKVLSSSLQNSVLQNTSPMTPGSPRSPRSSKRSLSVSDIEMEANTVEVLNVKMNIGLSKLKEYLIFLKKRGGVFFQDCFNTYYSIRYDLVYYRIRRCLEAQVIAKDNIMQFVVAALTLLIKSIEDEEALFYGLFFEDEANMLEVEENFAISPLVNAYCVVFYEKLRSVLLSQNNIGTLCDLSSLLNKQFLGKVASLDGILSKIIADLEEVICFKANQFIQNEIVGFVKPGDAEEEKGVDLMLEIVKKLLSKLYGVISKRSFEDLVKETLFYVKKSLIAVSKSIEKKQEKGKGSYKLHSLLFLLKSFLSIRQDISVYKISFVKTEIKLDFSHIGEGILNFLRGKSTINIKTIIFDILINSQPKVLYKKIQMKKNLDFEIKTVCENLILNVTKNNFSHVIDSIYTQQFDKKEVYEYDLKGLEEKLKNEHELIKKYLKSKETREHLENAIKTNLLKIYKQYIEINELKEAWVGSNVEGEDAKEKKGFQHDEFIPPIEKIEEIVSSSFSL